MTKLRPFFTYYGGKYRIALRYPEPMHRVLIEPFCGSAGYAVRYPARDVRLYDANPVIVAVWNYLISVQESEIASLPEIFHDVRTLSIAQEAKWLIGFWLNKGTASPCNRPSKWMLSGVRPHSHWGAQIKHRIASQLKHIRHWRCSLSDYIAIPNQRATWLIDPPYCGAAGRHYVFSEIDYSKLAAWCKSRDGQAIVCEQQDARWLPFRPFCDAKTSRGSIKEVIWHRSL
jgi:hypothetical protein